jgi:hypothetical protein
LRRPLVVVDDLDVNDGRIMFGRLLRPPTESGGRVLPLAAENVEESA